MTTFFQTLHIKNFRDILLFVMFVILLFWPLIIEDPSWMASIFIVNALIMINTTHTVITIRRKREKEQAKKKRAMRRRRMSDAY